MSRPLPRRRRGGPLVTAALDLVRAAVHLRRLSLIPLVVLVALAALISLLSLTAAPWLIYPGL